MIRRYRWLIRLLCLCACCAADATGGEAPPAVATAIPTFPRLMGMNIGAKNYDDPSYADELARLDVVILAFYPGWNPPGFAASSTAAIRKAVQAMKKRAPHLLVGQYTVLSEAGDDSHDAATEDLRAKLNASGWWAKNRAGRKVQWTADYKSWEVNITPWTKPDGNGKRWPEWLATRNDAIFFSAVPELDIVYVDNVMAVPRVRADWAGEGRDDDPADPRIRAAYRAGHRAYWDEIRKLHPRTLIVGNVDHDLEAVEFRGQLDGAFLEALMGEPWSIERREGWHTMMERYRGAMRNTRGARIVGFNVVGAATDLRLFRYAYTSCLLDDGYFSFTDRARGYSSVPWFDEYEHKLGRALSGPPTRPWKDGVWRRDFERGIVLVNPTAETRTLAMEPGLRRISGRQDSAVNDGAVADRISIPSKDGVVLRRDDARS